MLKANELRIGNLVSQKATHLLQLNASSKGIAHVPGIKDK